MIYELRTYTCQPGTVQTVLNLWENEGKAMLAPYFHMVGQWVTETGTANQIVTLWRFDDMNHRQKARADLMKHPGFAEYLARCRACYVHQESVFLSPTTLSPLQ